MGKIFCDPKTAEEHQEGNFLFPKCVNAISHSSVDTIGKLELIGKIAFMLVVSAS